MNECLEQLCHKTASFRAPGVLEFSSSSNFPRGHYFGSSARGQKACLLTLDLIVETAHPPSRCGKVNVGSSGYKGMLRSAGSHARPLLRLHTSWRCFGTESPEQQLENKLRGLIDGVQHVKVSKLHNCSGYAGCSLRLKCHTIQRRSQTPAAAVGLCTT